jgi:hypothetical protein
MVRLTYEYNTPDLKSRDPRSRLPPVMTAEQRRALHQVLWPSDMSVRFTVRQWLIEKSFDCLEEAFTDLEVSQARFACGALKQVSFLGGAREFVDAKRGMTEAEVTQFMGEWRAKYPKSLLAEVMWPAMLLGAAWNVRGSDYAQNVPPQNMRAFRRLIAAGQKQLYALSDAAPRHVLGHYVAMMGIVDTASSPDQFVQFALASMRRYPQEAPLAAIAGRRLAPVWGGSPTIFEAFARSVRDVVGPDLADRTYAYLYTRSIDMNEWQNFPNAQMARIRDGLLDYAKAGTFDEIATLQAFACLRRDAEALRRAQTLWTQYSREPQLRAPADELDGECRAWEATLPRQAIEPEAAAAPPHVVTPSPDSAAGSMVSSASNAAVPMLYSVAPGPWERLSTPVGEVYSCTDCEYPVQVLFALGPPLGPTSPLGTNEAFLKTLEGPTQQAAMVIDLMSALSPDLKTNGALSIERTGFGQLGGLRAFQYDAVVKMRARSIRETATVVVVRNRLLRVAINRGVGPVGPKEEKVVADLLAGIRLATE